MECTSETRGQCLQDFLQMRGVDTPCKQCGGLGTRTYGTSSTWRNRPSGQMMTTGVCDHCWGSGDEDRKWPDLRVLEARMAALKKAGRDVLEFLPSGDHQLKHPPKAIVVARNLRALVE